MGFGFRPVLNNQPVPLRFDEPFTVDAVLIDLFSGVFVDCMVDCGDLEQGFEVGELLVGDVGCGFGEGDGYVLGGFVGGHGGGGGLD